MSKGKLIIFSAPSGSGKTTIIQWIMGLGLNLGFSVSATSRPPRGQEENGKDYYFLSPAEFREYINKDAFLEWEEVYTDKYYGTLKSEVEKKLNEGKNILLDVDVKGGLNVKKIYGPQALSIFIQPPGIDILKKRLELRGTDSAEVIKERVEKAKWELSFAPQFDNTIINDDLETAKNQCYHLIKAFIE